MYWVVQVQRRATGAEERWFVQAPYSKKRTKEILVSAYAEEYEVVKIVKDQDPNAGVKVAPMRRDLIDGLIAGDITIGEVP